MAEKGKKKRSLPAAFLKKFVPSPELAAVIGSSQLTRQEATKKIWEYIKKNKLQDKREINSDDKLKSIFKKDRFSMFEIAKALKEHLKEV